MKKAVITGATGLIGRALIKKLTELDVELLIIVRDRKKLNSANLNFNARIIECDLNNLSNFPVSATDYDVFFHLGWDGTRGVSRLDESAQNKNIAYTEEAVRLAKRLGCKAFVGVGSQAEYGKVKDGVKLSPALKEMPESAYGKAKLSARNSACKLCNEYGIKFCWCRVLSTYGAYDNPNTLIMHTISECLKGNVCNLTPCEQQWDYIYNEDIAEGLVLIAEKGLPNKTYVIGTGITRPLKAFVSDIYDAAGNKNAKLNFAAIDYYPDQVMYLCADISDLKRDTGFEPRFSFEEGIKKTIEWYKKNCEN